MKKRICFIALSVLALTLTACGSNSKSQTAQGVITQRQSSIEDNSNNDANQNENVQESNILIAYFTVPETDGVDAVASASRVVTADGVLGNTEFIATEIQKNLGGVLFAIETEQDYLAIMGLFVFIGHYFTEFFKWFKLRRKYYEGFSVEK